MYGTYLMTGQGLIYYPNTGFAGIDTMTYELCNMLNECGTALITITVLDTQVPLVTLSGSTPITIDQGTTYTEQGATWTDNVDGSGTILTATSGTVDTNTIGTYILEYTYTDGEGNSGSAMRTVNVTDQTNPVVTLSGLTSITINQ